MDKTLDLLIQLADGFARQFGPDCEVVIHDLKKKDPEHSIVHIYNGHVTGRAEGEGLSKVVLEAIQKKPKDLKDQIGYLTTTDDGKYMKSSTFYIRDDTEEEVEYLVSVNYDITGLMAIDRSVRNLVEPGTGRDARKKPEKILHNVNDLLESLIQQSVEMIGKPAILMSKEEKVAAIQFLNDAGAFLITKSGDKISKYFGISKYTLYSYIDVNK